MAASIGSFERNPTLSLSPIGFERSGPPATSVDGGIRVDSRERGIVPVDSCDVCIAISVTSTGAPFLMPKGLLPILAAAKPRNPARIRVMRERTGELSVSPHVKSRNIRCTAGSSWEFLSSDVKEASAKVRLINHRLSKSDLTVPTLRYNELLLRSSREQ